METLTLTSKQTIKEQTNEILVNNGLDFTIVKQPLVGLNGLKTPYYGLFNDKTNECLNTCKEGYEVSQNNEIVELVLEGMRPFGNDLKVSKAGALNGGRKVFIQMAIEGDGILSNDRIKRYVTVIDSNDGSTSLSIGIGDLTMSCSNQFAKFYKKGNAKFRHTASMQKRISEIPMLIELALNNSLKQIEIYKQFQSTECSKDLIHGMVKHLVGIDKGLLNGGTISMEKLTDASTQARNKMDAIYSHIEREMSTKGQNIWGLHSGITSYTTHKFTTPKRNNGHIESILGGGAYNLNNDSFDFALQQIGINVREFEMA